MFRTTRAILASLLLLVAGALAVTTSAHAAYEEGVGICETTTTTGQGTLDLAGAYTTGIDYLTFVSQIASGNTVPYTIESSDGKFEHGEGVFTDASPDTLSRASNIFSSDGVGTKLTLPAGTHIVCLQSGAYSWNEVVRAAGFDTWVATPSMANLGSLLTDDAAGWTTFGTTPSSANFKTLVTDETGTGGAVVFATDPDISISATTESNIESAIDTLANLTSIQGRTVTLADAGANAFFGWDDTASAYENLTDAEAEAIMEPLIDTLANLTSIQGRTVTYTDGGADAVWGWDDSADAYENLTGAEVAAAIGDNIALTTNTTGNYVKDVADGTGIDGTAAGEGATYTPSLDLTEITPGTGLDTGATSIDLDFTEISSATWGAGSFTTFTFDAGATDPLLTFGSGTLLIEAVLSLRQADAANAGGQLKWLEDPGTGSNFISILAPASITSDVTCTLENDSNPIPDSCVGDGTDDTGSGVGGSTGATDNAILRADGTGGSTLQNSPLIIADTTGSISGGNGSFTIEFNGGTAMTLGENDTDLTLEGNRIFRVGGADVPVADGGTGASSLADLIALSTNTTGNYVQQVADGTGIDGSVNSEGGTYTPSIDATELTGTTTFGAGSATVVAADLQSTDDVIVGNAITLAVDGGGQITTSAGTLIYQTAQSITNPALIRLHETTSSGTNFKSFAAAATITSDNTCVFENDSHFVPDSCVGNGADDTSDARLKKDLTLADEKAVGAMLDQVRIYDFKWNQDAEIAEKIVKDAPGFGPIAQEIYEVNPLLARPGGDDPTKEPWTFEAKQAVPYLIVETQSLRKRVAGLEAIKQQTPAAYRCYGIKLGSACIGVSM